MLAFEDIKQKERTSLMTRQSNCSRIGFKIENQPQIIVQSTSQDSRASWNVTGGYAVWGGCWGALAWKPQTKNPSLFLSDRATLKGR